jgi:hypothetical protein
LRKTFTTTIEEDIQKKFKLECVKNEINMNDVLEILMQQYINNNLTIKIKSKK